MWLDKCGESVTQAKIQAADSRSRIRCRRRPEAARAGKGGLLRMEQAQKRSWSKVRSFSKKLGLVQEGF